MILLVFCEYFWDTEIAKREKEIEFKRFEKEKQILV